jgi:high affinity Mn2+ porin
MLYHNILLSGDDAAGDVTTPHIHTDENRMTLKTGARSLSTLGLPIRVAVMLCGLCPSLPAYAQDASAVTQGVAEPATGGTTDDGTADRWAVHGQSTYTQQYQPAFHSPYQGPQSLSPAANGRETFDLTIMGGFRPWDGGEIWIDPELDQGFGLGNSFGVAGYLSGEAYKLGNAVPYYRMARAFFRQTINLGGDAQKVDADLNQFAETQTANRLVLTIGKISVVDIFDTNKYAHDPRNDFLNWSILDVGTFDYAAEAWGTTYGATAEWYQDRYALRLGVFDLSNEPNSTHVALPLFQQTQFVAEVEERHVLWEQPGKLKFLYWLSRGNLGTYTDALALAALTGGTPSTALVRNYRSKFGVALNLEQQLAPDLGMFVKVGWTEPDVEEDDFTDIDESATIGFSLTGARWGRPDDTVGLAGVVNQISHSGKLYLAAGGLGGIVGDGSLPEAGPEQIIETFYSFAPVSFGKITADYQFVNNPAYNRERGPVSALALRLHAEF